jgi:hypothetical protein
LTDTRVEQAVPRDGIDAEQLRERDVGHDQLIGKATSPER